MSTYDKASRLRTNLHTADGYYDQGLAVSQAVINSSFGKLYDRYPAMQTMSYDAGIAQMEGEMLPSRLIIPKAEMNLAKIIHQLRFKTGTLTVANNPNPIKLDKFVIGVICDLDMQFVKERPDETPEEKRQREFIEKEFRVPGDYRLERLYSKFTSAQWNHFDLYGSQYYDADGNPMTYEQWQKKDPTAAAAFGIMLSMYGTDMEAQGLSTLGLKITLPDLPPETKPTFIPTDMVHQIYPYRDEQGNSEYGDSPKGDRNCLLYLEVVKRADGTDGQLPDAKQVGYSGNFCYPSLSSTPGVDGTFLLGGPLFMGRYLLPQLQMLNEASSIYVDKNTYGGGSGGWAFPMTIGRDPRYANYENAAYAFKQSGDGLKWVYEKNVDKSTPVKERTGGGEWWSSDHWSKATTTVTWQPGSDLCVTFKGHYEYYRGITFAKNKQLTNPSTWSKEDYTGDWNLDIRMVVENGVLKLKLESAEDLGFVVTGDAKTSDNLGKYRNNKETLRDDIKKRILPRLEVLRNSLRDGFQGDHQFVFPGTGQLEFQDVTFNNEGDIIASVVWKEVDGPVIVKPPPKTSSANYSAGFQDPIEPHIWETTFRKTECEMGGEEET
ncbi:uncharacterized protein Triagg1_576 [Trichoderma aggressivum f. europaeum]|uniref:Uncharacterized protein n=1 Tax=Trichoderma aggressivum f. europaeum TaxID=173218 RepID=A0AAE1MA96_9HYPO|nr:hypothetical protein Triagg1_576 [Trichoderma aggressivum f. europaeum]